MTRSYISRGQTQLLLFHSNKTNDSRESIVKGRPNREVCNMRTFICSIVVIFLLFNSSNGGSIVRGNYTRIKRAAATCNLSGVCGENENGAIPCVVDNEPHKFEDTAEILDILKDECPELFPPGVIVPDVCCSPQDVEKMQNIMKVVSKMITNCPDCLQNSKELLCHFHCAPNQKEFVEITKTNGKAVDEINYYVSEPSLKGLFAACEKLPAVQMFLKMTGCKEGSCNVNDFVKAMGDRNLKSPFQMNVIVIKDDVPIVNGKPGKPAEFLIKEGGQCG